MHILPQFCNNSCTGTRVTILIQGPVLLVENILLLVSGSCTGTSAASTINSGPGTSAASTNHIFSINNT